MPRRHEIGRKPDETPWLLVLFLEAGDVRGRDVTTTEDFRVIEVLPQTVLYIQYSGTVEVAWHGR